MTDEKDLSNYSHLMMMDESGNKELMKKDEIFSQIIIFLADKHTNGRLHKGAIETTMVVFPYSYNGIQRLWYKNRGFVLNPTTKKLDVVGKYKGKVGRPPKYSEKDFKAIKLIPLFNWTSLRLVGMQIGIPYVLLVNTSSDHGINFVFQQQQ